MFVLLFYVIGSAKPFSLSLPLLLGNFLRSKKKESEEIREFFQHSYFSVKAF